MKEEGKGFSVEKEPRLRKKERRNGRTDGKRERSSKSERASEKSSVRGANMQHLHLTAEFIGQGTLRAREEGRERKREKEKEEEEKKDQLTHK